MMAGGHGPALGHGVNPRRSHTPLSRPSPLLSFPLPSVVTLNINSLGFHAQGAQGLRRRARKLNFISKLASADILCLQETRLGALESSALKLHFPLHSVFYNNLSLGRAGTIVLVQRRFAALWNIEQVDIGPQAKGWVQVLHFTPRGEGAQVRRDFHLVNAYLPSGDQAHSRLSLLNKVTNFGRAGLLFLVGDLNMTEFVEDSSSGESSSILLKGPPKEAWVHFLQETRLKEVHQPAHTHFFLPTDASLARSSRIDRIYTNLPDSVLLLANPVAHTPYAGPSPLSVTARDPKGNKRSLKRLFVSDHVPVALSFYVLDRKVKRRFNAPSWLGAQAGIAETIKDHWVGFDPDSGVSPFQAIQDWKATVRQVVRTYFEDAGNQRQVYQDSLQKLTAATALLAECARVHQDRDRISGMLKRHPFLADGCQLVNGRYGSDGPSRVIDGLLADSIRNESRGDFWHEEEADLSLPASYLPGAGRLGGDPISRIKARLPCDRSRLTCLRASLSDPLTSDPEEMGDIIEDHYSEVWGPEAKAPSVTETRTFLQKVHLEVPPDLQPALPTVDDMIDVILGSNNSCAGPDGIPFSFYKAYIKVDRSLAVVLAAICAQLGRGVLPPEGYNHARFFLIPKKGGGLIAHTRGISVTNGDNRLVATGMKRAVEPALQKVLGDSQQGFIGGRQGETHIRGLMGDFYARLNAKQQRFVLLLDMERAFDSLSHRFLHACLSAMRLSGWFCRAVVGLLSNVVVFPVLSTITKHSVTIHKGVKQGCPLSPLLFVICFEFLLVALDCGARVVRFAFADDLALALSSVSLLLRALSIVREFAKVSGLRMNLGKTVIVPTRSPSRRARQRLTEAGWGGINFVDSAKYLGLLFGRFVSTVDIFRDALVKFNKRLRLFSPVLASSSLHDRILIFNTFLLPLFYYLGRFVVIPYHEVVAPVRRAAHRRCVAFHGGFAYPHLVAPRHLGMSPATPLKDLWAVNMVLLGWDFRMEDSHRGPTPELGSWHWVSQYGGLDHTLDPGAHSAYAAFVFLESYTPRAGSLIDLSDLPKLGKAARRRAWLYNRLADRGYWIPRTSTRKKTSLAVKLQKFAGRPTACPTEAGHAQKNAAIARKRVTPSQWNTHLRLVLNVLPFTDRRQKAGMIETVEPCFLCGGASDSSSHVFLCPRVCEARKVVGVRAGCSMPSGLMYTALMYPPTRSELGTVTTVVFNWTVWSLRTSFFSTLRDPQDRSATVNRIVRHTLYHLHPEGRGRPPLERQVVALATQPPRGVTVFFSDGSSLDNGSGGAGYSIQTPHRLREDFAVPLGPADNNAAEMAALKGCLRRLLELHRLIGLSGQVIGFSDSACCLGFLLKGWQCPTDVVLARETRRLLHEVRRRFSIKLFWVRGHNGLAGNERVDGLAKRGAAGAALGPGLGGAPLIPPLSGSMRTPSRLGPLRPGCGPPAGPTRARRGIKRPALTALQEGSALHGYGRATVVDGPGDGGGLRPPPSHQPPPVAPSASSPPP